MSTITRGDPPNLRNVRRTVYHHYIRVDNPKSHSFSVSITTEKGIRIFRARLRKNGPTPAFPTCRIDKKPAIKKKISMILP